MTPQHRRLSTNCSEGGTSPHLGGKGRTSPHLGGKGRTSPPSGGKHHAPPFHGNDAPGLLGLIPPGAPSATPRGVSCDVRSRDVEAAGIAASGAKGADSGGLMGVFAEDLFARFGLSRNSSPAPASAPAVTSPVSASAVASAPASAAAVTPHSKAPPPSAGRGSISHGWSSPSGAASSAPRGMGKSGGEVSPAAGASPAGAERRRESGAGMGAEAVHACELPVGSPSQNISAMVLGWVNRSS